MDKNSSQQDTPKIGIDEIKEWIEEEGYSLM